MHVWNAFEINTKQFVYVADGNYFPRLTTELCKYPTKLINYHSLILATMPIIRKS